MNENDFQLQCNYRCQIRRWTEAFAQTPDAATDINLQIGFELQLERLLAEAKTKLSKEEFSSLKQWTAREVRMSWGVVKKEHTLEKFIPEELTQWKKAALELKSFLKDGKRPALECQEYLKSRGFEIGDWCRVRKYAGVETAKKERKSWWFLSSPSVEIIESCDEGFRLCFAENSGLELIDEDNCGFVGWGEVTK